MSETDNHKPRRYRAEVKRVNIVKRSGQETERRWAENETPAESVEETTKEVVDDSAMEAKTSAASDQGTQLAEEAEAESSFDIRSRNKNYVDETRIMPQGEFEYVVPKETFKEHAKNRRKATSSTHKGATKKASEEEMEEAEKGFVFATPRKRKKHKHHSHHGHHHHRRKFRHLALWKRILIVLAAIILAVVILTGGTFLILHEIGRSSMHSYENAQVIPPSTDEAGKAIIPVDKTGRVITYDGVTYELNEDLIAVTFIGVDDGQGEEADLRMSDAIYILTADTVTGKVRILGISRDTMADIDLYSEEGAFVDTEKKQMAYAYAYGNEKVSGGKNTNTSISRLFYGLPFNNYFAINLNALITLNDTIGGVTLTSSMTFTSPIDGRTINEGETVTLHGKEAERYVRSRDTEVLDSNNARMQRQQEYIRAFLQSIVPAAKKDISVISKLYDEIKVNSDSSLDIAKMTYIASTALTKLRNASDIEYVNLKGEITAGEHAEMHVTNENAIRTMLDVFYTPLADVPTALK
ncbi:MAG: LCP family protein [Ruminococcus sp.]|nr:LCP family protein [Ruminococcus sp.]